MLYCEQGGFDQQRGTATTNLQKADPCPRCRGRMFKEEVSGDKSCFTCGHVIYGMVPLPFEPGRRLDRRPSHGGQSLD
jgi:hypothetical protein